MSLQIDEKGSFVDINGNRSFIDSAKLAKFVYNNEPPFVVMGGYDLQSKREAAAIIKNVYVAIQKHGIPETTAEWRKVANTAAKIG